MDNQLQLDAIREICPDALLWKDGGQEVIYLPAFSFPTREGEKVSDLLLVPTPHSGYPSRLFFKNQIVAAPNWQMKVVCGQQWYAVSWAHMPENLTWPQLLAGHLRAML